MKKYKLKKELPTFKVGEVFGIDCDGHLRSLEQYQEYRSIGLSIRVIAYSKSDLDRFPNILKDWFEEIPEDSKTVFDLKDGDEYWMLDMDLEPLQIEWRSTSFDIRLRELGLIYLSKKELVAATAKKEAKVILERDTKGFKPDWRKKTRESEKWYVAWNIDVEDLITDYTNIYREDRIYFATQEDAKESIKKHEKEWKIYLGVEE